MPPKAKESFRFCSRLSLTLLTGIKAGSLPELLFHLRTVPESVIYHHTHRFLQQHQHLVPEPPNDFAYWAANILGDEELGERLAAIDTVRFDSLDGIRNAIIAAVESHLHDAGSAHTHCVPAGKEFHFMKAVRFSMPTPYQADDLPGFANCLEKVSISSLYLHVFEARLRPPLGVNDFSHWFKTQLGDEALARRVADLDPYTQTLEGLRRRILGIVRSRLQEAPYAEA